MKSFQEIYDFCNSDNTWRNYHEVPPQLAIRNRRVDKYYYGEIRRGQCRTGTFYYYQAFKQLERFLGKETCTDWYFHIRPDNYQIEDVHKFNGIALYIRAHIRADGVEITFTHPITGTDLSFVARSHRPFTQQGIIDETRAYIEKHLLLPPGRYRDLQIENRIPKPDFPAWYRRYREMLHDWAEMEHKEMLAKYDPKRQPLSFEDAYDILATSGILHDFCSDEYEREELAGEFADLCNRNAI